MMRNRTRNRFSLKVAVSVIFLASVAFSSHAKDVDYNQLSGQSKADLARYLGWVWGDGRPGYDGTGIIYKGGNSRYAAVVDRLAKIKVGGVKNPFGFPESGDRKYARVWDYWENSLPGGNIGDPQILRDAIRNPNFLAGIIEGEGQIFHDNPNQDFSIADQSYAPSHPDKIYDIAYFGPERMIQLFSLLHETYGFNNPAMSIGGVKYNYNTHSCEVAERIRDLYDTRKAQNERGNLQSGFTVKIYVKPPYLSEIASYGYFSKDSGKYRTPAPDRSLSVIRNSEPDQNTGVSGGMSFFNSGGTAGTQLLHSTGDYLSSGVNVVSNVNSGETNWQLLDLRNGYYRVEAQNSSRSKTWLQALNNGVVRLTSEDSDWHWTQWKRIPVPNTNNRYYLKNRYHGTYLRVGTSDGAVKHGVAGGSAEWRLKVSNNQCG